MRRFWYRTAKDGGMLDVRIPDQAKPEFDESADEACGKCH